MPEAITIPEDPVPTPAPGTAVVEPMVKAAVDTAGGCPMKEEAAAVAPRKLGRVVVVVAAPPLVLVVEIVVLF